MIPDLSKKYIVEFWPKIYFHNCDIANWQLDYILNAGVLREKASEYDQEIPQPTHGTVRKPTEV